MRALVIWSNPTCRIECRFLAWAIHDNNKAASLVARDLEVSQSDGTWQETYIKHPLGPLLQWEKQNDEETYVDVALIFCTGQE